MTPDERETPGLLGTSHFRVLIGSHELGFAEVGRISTDTDPAAAPGECSHRFETIVLRRALGRTSELYAWRRRITSGEDDRRAVTIQQLDAAGGEVVNAWRLERAWPARWSGPSFDASRTEVAMEEVELVFEELVWLTSEGG
jgi:hypothetical protein